MARIHFISGLPRSGSTLLSALLRQNPRFHAGMSGPLAGMVGALLAEMSGRNEFSLFIDDAQRQRVVRGLFDNYYADCSAEVIVDTSRAWCARIGAMAQLFPDAKVIACVRHVPWIIDSIERVIQRNAFSPSSIFNYSPGGTVYTRANGVAGTDGLLGYAYDALKGAFYSEHADRLLAPGQPHAEVGAAEHVGGMLEQADHLAIGQERILLLEDVGIDVERLEQLHGIAAAVADGFLEEAEGVDANQLGPMLARRAG